MNSEPMWVELEGAIVDRDYLIDTIAEAREERPYEKVKRAEIIANGDTHVNCEICLRVLAEIPGLDFAYYSFGIWLCSPCHERFIEKEDFLKSVSELPAIEDEG
ncbi:MAG: hypothetical protein V4642_14370 [Bacteroidota bacterium]|jgi:hypothetical protein